MKNFNVLEVPITQGPWAKFKPVIIHQPTGNPLPNGLWPLIDYSHGIGVQGSNPEAFFGEQALPLYIERNGSVYGLFDGKRVDFIVIAVQADSFSPEPAWKPIVLEYLGNQMGIPFDPRFISATGVSAGGTKALECLTNPETAKIYSCGVPMSLQGITEHHIKNLMEQSIETWFHCGRNEGGNYTSATETAHKLANLVYPGSSTITYLPNPGHGPWLDAYKPSEEGTSIYDWMLMHPRKPIGDVTGPVITQPKVSIELYEDGTWKHKNSFNGDFQKSFQVKNER